MPTLNNGVFSITINSEDLARGLRSTRRAPRNTKFLTICKGAVGLDNVLQVLRDISVDAIDISGLGALTFPYPQLFIFINVILICTPTKIYELIAGVPTIVFTASASGILWSAADFYNFIYASNGKVVAIRRATDGLWEESTAYPIAGAICNYNGQVMIGAPDVEQP